MNLIALQHGAIHLEAAPRPPRDFDDITGLRGQAACAARLGGPMRSGMTMGAALRATLGLHVTSTVSAPRLLASARPARTKGVTPLAAMPTTASRARARARTARAPAPASSSAPSTDLKTARRPPAITAWTSEGRVLKVGGHPAASSPPRR